MRTIRTTRRRTLGPALITLSALAVAPALTNCGGKGMPGMPGGGGSCPDSPDAIFQASWGLDAQLEGKVKAGLAAAANLKDVAAKLEGEVSMACGNLAKDLGASDADLEPKEGGPGKKAEAACSAAAKLIGDLKAKAKGTLKVDAQPPRCSASMNVMADCAAKCDATVKPGEVDVKCEGGELSGKCDAECKGSCSMEAGAECKGTCKGTCSGSCEAGFSGKCEGDCEGKCDGQNAKGKCAGTCEGKCSASGSGSCTGQCGGKCDASCEVQATGKCEGTCTGECSVKMEAPSCTGEVKPPEMSAECKANCDAELSAKAECEPATVVVTLEGAADAQAATKLKVALQKNLPMLLKVTLGLKGTAEKAAASVQASLEGVSAAVKGGADAALKVGPCIAAALEAQAQASASINVSVKASASASGSASAG